MAEFNIAWFVVALMIGFMVGNANIEPPQFDYSFVDELKQITNPEDEDFVNESFAPMPFALFNSSHTPAKLRTLNPKDSTQIIIYTTLDDGVPPAINGTQPTLKWDELNESFDNAVWIYKH